MAKYVKILNNKNSACAYCRLFTQDEVTVAYTGSSYEVTFKDGTDVNNDRDFMSLYQITGGADLPKTQEDAIYWAPEPIAPKEREWWGTIWLDNYSTATDGTKYYDARVGTKSTRGFGTEEEATELLYGATASRIAFLHGGAGMHNANRDYVYSLSYNPTTGKYYTTNQTTAMYAYVGDLVLYDENPNYTATITGLTLNATEVSLARGEGFLFFAQVTGTGNFDPAVHYLMMGADADGGTTHDPATGLITIGMNETSPTITMLCEVVADPSFNETITITVTDPLPRPDPVEVAYRRESFFAGFAAGLALYSKKYKP